MSNPLDEQIQLKNEARSLPVAPGRESSAQSLAEYLPIPKVLAKHTQPVSYTHLTLPTKA